MYACDVIMVVFKYQIRIVISPINAKDFKIPRRLFVIIAGNCSLVVNKIIWNYELYILPRLY